MRLIGTLSTADEVERLSFHLQQKGIETHTDLAIDAVGQPVYQIWVLEEDKIREAVADFALFRSAPVNFSSPPREPVEEVQPPVQKAKTPVTIFFLALSFAIFFLNAVEELPLREENLASLFLTTPIQELLFYDLPSPLIQLENFVEEHALVPGEKIENLAPAMQAKLTALASAPYFRGLFDWLILKFKGKDTAAAEGPLFLKIRQGEVWRLFSPCVLHAQFLHILFNMIWLWILGRPIEQRIGMKKTLALTFMTGIGSNTFQYLAGGPLFLGYSGVIMGLAGFIWSRERHFPWEGYSVQKGLFLFLLLFVLAIFLLSLSSFFFEMWTELSFAPNIANTAHIAGGAIGLLLGRWSWFSWHPRPEASRLYVK
ncbi:MAG: rhomboid family intramembrane serine protease [Verrucomicrobiota bacterium]|nr:rhomboid family intramembrane serine protease [Verrucomicrobiota bacterium]